MPGEEEKYPYADGYRELVYSDGELVEENCIWSDSYKGGIKLYPDWPEWKKVEMTVSGIVMNKYIRVVAETD